MNVPTLKFSTKPPAKAETLIVVRGHDLPKPVTAELERAWATGCALAHTRTLGHGPHEHVVAFKLDDATDARAVTRRYAAAARVLLREKVKSAAVVVPPDFPEGSAPALVAGLLFGLYRFERYKTTSKSKTTGPEVTIVHPSRSFATHARLGVPLGEAQWLTRDLINTPAEDMGPSEFEAEARRVAKEAGLKIRVLSDAQCKRLKMGALTTVGRASDDPPRMVVLEHQGGRGKGFLALAGKGICFDTGGLDLKNPAGMLLMKKDMGGAATVLGAAYAIGKLKPKVNVRFYLPLAENAVAGNAFRPGDIVTAMDGTTIEVANTDAEGRLVLADAVAYAKKEGAKAIVDAATLTGSALYALGRIRVPLVGTDDALMGLVEASADAMGERVWRLPNDKEYAKRLSSKIADIRNIGKGPDAGAILGGLFIARFAGDVPFAHLDISPASWSEGDHDLGPEGATGVMVATLVELVRRHGG